MALSMRLWAIEGNKLQPIPKTKLESELRLESWLAEDSSLLGIEVLIIARQLVTPFGGRIDLLGIDRQGDLVVIELKRDKTPREIVAQVLDYASWVRTLSFDEIAGFTGLYLKEGLNDAFNLFYEEVLPEIINTNHSMIIVASEFDDSSERIVQYLAEEYKVNINVVFFSYFKHGNQEQIGRAWLIDPEQVKESSKTRKRAAWSGYWFVNVGEGAHRNWDDNREYGYIGAGQGVRYSRALRRLKVGDKIFAYLKGLGYVGYGEVTREAAPISDFIEQKSETRLLDLPLKAPNASENIDNPDLSEWVVGVKWLRSFPREQAKTFKGAFANQNIVCELRQPETVAFLEREFIPKEN